MKTKLAVYLLKVIRKDISYSQCESKVYRDRLKVKKTEAMRGSTITKIMELESRIEFYSGSINAHDIAKNRIDELIKALSDE